MHLTVAKVGGEENVFTIEISSDLSLKDLKVIIEAESDFGINAEQMILLYEGLSLFSLFFFLFFIDQRIFF